MARVAGEKLIRSDLTLRAWLDERAKAAKAGKPLNKIRRLNDGNGLVLLDVEGARPGWRFEYKAWSEDKGRVAAKMISLGVYPTVTLEGARTAAAAKREEVGQGVDPSKARQQVREQARASDAQRKEDQARIADGKAPVGSFEAVAVALHDEKVAASHWGQRHAKEFLRTVRVNFSPIRFKRLPAISQDELKACLDSYTAQGKANTAKDMLEYAGQIFRHGRKQGLVKHNITAELIEDDYVLRPLSKAHPKLKDQSRLGELVNAARAKNTTGANAVLMQTMLFQRSSNTAQMDYAHIDWPARVWRIPSVQVKLKADQQARFDEHIVPLPRQALQLLLSMCDGNPPASGPVFASREGGGKKAIDRNTLLKNIRALGFTAEEVNAHGLRGTAFSAIENHIDGDYTQAVEANLAHVYGGNMGATYNEADYVEKRRAMLQAWCDHLDRLASGEWQKEEEARQLANLRKLQSELGAALPVPLKLAA